jgi:hypothetical protein
MVLDAALLLVDMSGHVGDADEHARSQAVAASSGAAFGASSSQSVEKCIEFALFERPAFCIRLPSC